MDGKPPPPKRSELPPLPVTDTKESSEQPLASGSVRKPFGPKVFQCPKCGATVSIRAVGSTVTVACGSCASVIDAKDPNYQILSTAAKNIRVQPLIPLGQRGKLHGVLWEVIGFMIRTDGTGAYTWDEYLLFNPSNGFRWLTQAQGHWNYVVTPKERPKQHGNYATCMGKKYTRFLEGTAVVTYVLGEFYWRVKVGNKTKVADYVSPPEILSYESDGNEAIWSIGEYIPADTIRVAFDIKAPAVMPAQLGVAPNEPCRYANISAALLSLWAAFALVLFLAQIVDTARAPDLPVFQERFPLPAGTAGPITSPSFVLGHGTTNLQLTLVAPVSNAWLEISGELVNEENGETDEFEIGVEYYSGSDSDGSWSEGSHSSSRVLSSVPAGRYHLSLNVSGGSVSHFDLSMVRGVSTWSNFFICALLLSILPLFFWFQNLRTETERWSQSDYTRSGTERTDDSEDDD